MISSVLTKSGVNTNVSINKSILLFNKQTINESLTSHKIAVRQARFERYITVRKPCWEESMQLILSADVE